MSVFVNGQKIDDIIKAEAERMRPQYEQAFKDMDKDEREAQLLDWSKENAVEQVLLRQLAAEEFSEIAEPEIEESYQKTDATKFRK